MAVSNNILVNLFYIMDIISNLSKLWSTKNKWNITIYCYVSFIFNISYYDYTILIVIVDSIHKKYNDRWVNL